MRIDSRLQLAPWRMLLLACLVSAAVLACMGCTPPSEPQGNVVEALEDGVYAVLREAPTQKEARGGGKDCVVFAYDRAKYTGAAPGEPVRYVALAPSPFVPMILEGAPEAQKDEGGKTILSVTLDKQYVEALEDFTEAHLNGKIAILLDGEIVTIHKIRSVIKGGKFQVTRCTDNACEILRAKLTE